ncbi:unnamed protein product [Penicillium nalgiovense]|nr:unnamed protein product [Penicillium nalgiovense]
MFALSTLSDQYLREYRASEVVFLIHAGGLVCLVLDAMDDEDSEVGGAAQHALGALLFALAPEAVVRALIPTLLRYLKDGTGRRKRPLWGVLPFGPGSETGKVWK